MITHQPTANSQMFYASNFLFFYATVTVSPQCRQVYLLLTSAKHSDSWRWWWWWWSNHLYFHSTHIGFRVWNTLRNRDFVAVLRSQKQYQECWQFDSVETAACREQCKDDSGGHTSVSASRTHITSYSYVTFASLTLTLHSHFIESIAKVLCSSSPDTWA